MIIEKKLPTHRRLVDRCLLVAFLSVRRDAQIRR